MKNLRLVKICPWSGYLIIPKMDLIIFLTYQTEFRANGTILLS